MHCSRLSPPRNGRVSSNEATHGVVVLVSCDTGFMFSTFLTQFYTTCVEGGWTKVVTDCSGIQRVNC